MNKTIRAAGLGLAVSLIASAALAQASATKVAHDAAGASFNLAGQTDAASGFHYRDVMEGLLNGAPTAAAMDPAGTYLGVVVEGLPAITFATPQHVIVDSQTAASGGPTLANQQLTLTADQAIQANTASDATNNAAFQGEVTLTVGTADTVARRSLKANCTAAGNVAVTYADGSAGVWPVAIGIQTLPIAITTVTSSNTTATCTYANLK